MNAETERVFDVKDGEFEERVAKRSAECAVVVDFWAPWCGPCKILGPLLEKKIEARGGEVVLAKVNVEEAPELAQQFQVQSIPFVLAFRGGKPIEQFVGVLPEPEIDRFLDSLQPSKSDAAADKAAPLQEVDPERAATLYQEALEADPSHERSLLGLAEVRVGQGAERAAVEELLDRVVPGGEHEDDVRRLRALLQLRDDADALPSVDECQAAVDASPEAHEAHFQLGRSLAAAGRYPGALASLLEAARLDKTFAKETVRDAMVQIFYVVGVRSPLADDYRSKLASALY